LSTAKAKDLLNLRRDELFMATVSALVDLAGVSTTIGAKTEILL